MFVTVVSGIHNTAEMLLPYFLRHYSVFADRIVLYDRDCGEAVRKIALSDPKVELRDGWPAIVDTIEDSLRCDTVYKGFRGQTDWLIFPCTDELVHCTSMPMRNALQDYFDNGVNLPVITGYNMYHDELPDTDKQLWEVYKLGVYNLNFSKPIVFDPNIEMNFRHGLHRADPTSPVVKGNTHHLKLLHYRYWGAKQLKELHLKRYAISSQRNKDAGFGNYHPEGHGYLSLEWFEEEKKQRTEVI